MLDQSLNKLKLIAKKRTFKDYKIMFKERLLSAPEWIRIIMKNNLSTQKIKEIEKNLFELDKIFLNLKSIMTMLILNTKEQEMLEFYLVCQLMKIIINQ